MEAAQAEAVQEAEVAVEAAEEAASPPDGSAKKRKKRATAVEAAQAKVDTAMQARATAAAKFEKKSAEWGDPAAGTDRAKRLAAAKLQIEKKQAAVTQAKAAVLAVEQKAKAAALAASQAAEKAADDKERAWRAGQRSFDFSILWPAVDGSAWVSSIYQTCVC